MKNLVIQVDNNKYLIRYKVLKSVVSKKHTTYEYKKHIDQFTECISDIKVPIITNKLELHPNSVVVYLYKYEHIITNTHNALLQLNTRKKVKEAIYHGAITYLGRGLSKCSDKDKFDINIGVRCAIANIENLDALLAHDINYKVLNTNL